MQELFPLSSQKSVCEALTTSETAQGGFESDSLTDSLGLWYRCQYSPMVWENKRALDELTLSVLTRGNLLGVVFPRFNSVQYNLPHFIIFRQRNFKKVVGYKMSVIFRT